MELISFRFIESIKKATVEVERKTSFNDSALCIHKQKSREKILLKAHIFNLAIVLDEKLPVLRAGCGELLVNRLREGWVWREHGFVVSINFCGVSTLPMTDFKLPVVVWLETFLNI